MLSAPAHKNRDGYFFLQIFRPSGAFLIDYLLHFAFCILHFAICLLTYFNPPPAFAKASADKACPSQEGIPRGFLLHFAFCILSHCAGINHFPYSGSLLRRKNRDGYFFLQIFRPSGAFLIDYLLIFAFCILHFAFCIFPFALIISNI